MKLYGLAHYDEFCDPFIELISLSVDSLRQDDYNPECDLIYSREISETDVIGSDSFFWNPYEGNFRSQDYYYKKDDKIYNENELDEELDDVIDNDDYILGVMYEVYKDGKFIKEEFEPV